MEEKKKEEMYVFDIEVETRINSETKKEFLSYRAYSSKLKMWFNLRFPMDYPEEKLPKENGKLTVKHENIYRDKKSRFPLFRVKDYEKFEPVVYQDEDLSKYF